MSIMPLHPLLAGLSPEQDKAPRPGLVPGRQDRVVVMGSGKSGLAAARLCAHLGCQVHLLERNAMDEDLQQSLQALGIVVEIGEHSAAQFAGCQYVIPSPGIALRSILQLMGLGEDAGLEAEGEDTRPAILAETELAWRLLEQEKVVAVTGTSGKTTTVHLITAMLEEAGRSVCLAGNVGTPLSEYILDCLQEKRTRADVVVLELSSFQLQTCLRLRPDVAVLMNIAPNHLDYHRDMDEYVAAKMRLFACQTAGDKALVPQEWLPVFQKAGFAARSFQVAVDPALFPKRQLLGPHNALNACLAWEAVKDLGVPYEAAARAVAAFKPLPHRLEVVAEKGGVLYVNDSKSTTLASMAIALQAMDRPVLLLCGGHFKGGDPHELDDLVRAKVSRIAGFGDAKEIFLPAWQQLKPMEWFPTLKPAVEWLHAHAQAGDVVLLSPGTASFDLYKGMAYRGADFKAIVGGLQ